LDKLFCYFEQFFLIIFLCLGWWCAHGRLNGTILCLGIMLPNFSGFPTFIGKVSRKKAISFSCSITFLLYIFICCLYVCKLCFPVLLKIISDTSHLTTPHSTRSFSARVKEDKIGELFFEFTLKQFATI